MFVYVLGSVDVLLQNYLYYMCLSTDLYEIGESNESVSLPTKSSGVCGGHHIGYVYI